jgi:hypothetical protein
LLKKAKLSTLALFFVLVLMAAAFLVSVNAQGTATVIVNSATGGTTDVTGTTTYNDGDTVTITATPDADFVFVNWQVSPSDGSGDTQPTDNPLTYTAAGGVTYTITPVFSVPQPIPGKPLPTDLSTAAIVIIYPSSGGTTIPAPGTYALTNAANFDLVAMPNDGWQFAYWTICGENTSHGTAPVNWTPTDNPYNVNHGYGATYRYQAVFTPVGSTVGPSPTPTPTSSGGMGGLSNEMWIIIGLVVVIVVILVGFGVFASRRKK